MSYFSCFFPKKPKIQPRTSPSANESSYNWNFAFIYMSQVLNMLISNLSAFSFSPASFSQPTARSSYNQF